VTIEYVERVRGRVSQSDENSRRNVANDSKGDEVDDKEQDEVEESGYRTAIVDASPTQQSQRRLALADILQRNANNVELALQLPRDPTRYVDKKIQEFVATLVVDKSLPPFRVNHWQLMAVLVLQILNPATISSASESDLETFLREIGFSLGQLHVAVEAMQDAFRS